MLIKHPGAAKSQVITVRTGIAAGLDELAELGRTLWRKPAQSSRFRSQRRLQRDRRSN